MFKNAERIKATVPSLPIAFAVENFTGTLPKAIDFHIEIPNRPNNDREWLTRIQQIPKSPFELTLMADTHISVCSPKLLDDLLFEYKQNRFDIAFNLEFAPYPPYNSLKRKVPHNFAMLIRKSAKTEQLLHAWSAAQSVKPAADDQITLLSAIEAVPELRVERFREDFAAAFKSIDKRIGFFPRMTRVLEREVRMLHSYVPANVKNVGSICDFLNSIDVPRSLVALTDTATYKFITTFEECVAIAGNYSSHFCLGRNNPLGVKEWRVSDNQGPGAV